MTDTTTATLTGLLIFASSPRKNATRAGASNVSGSAVWSPSPSLLVSPPLAK